MQAFVKSAASTVVGAASAFHSDLHASFATSPVTTTLKLVGAAIATKVAVDLGRTIAKNMRIRYYLRTLPKPKGSLPFFGHALKLMVDGPWDAIEEWIKEFNYKPMAFDYLGQTGLVISDMESIRRVFHSKQRNYEKEIANAYENFLDLLGNGLVTSDGALWQRQRSLLSHALRVEILEETMHVAKRAADRLSKIVQESVDRKEPINIQMEFHILTLQVIGELILSLSPEESKSVFPQLYLPIVEEANARIWAPWRKYFFFTKEQRTYRETVKKLNAYMCDLIRKRWAKRQAMTVKPSVEETDVLDRVLDDIDPTTWSEATVLQLRDEVKTFILAGHETSASMMTWIMYLLSTNPDKKAKVLEEGQRVLGTCRGSGKTPADQFDAYELPGRDEINKLEYTLNSLKETLRLYSLVPVVTRKAVETDDLNGVLVPSGTTIFIHTKAVHHDPKVWAEPEKFMPERFFEKFDPCAFLPFIIGPRNCLGQNLALLEARVVIALLWQRFDFAPAEGNTGERDKKTVPIMPRDGMWLVATPREEIIKLPRKKAVLSAV